MIDLFFFYFCQRVSSSEFHYIQNHIKRMYSSSTCRAAITDLPDPFSTPVSIVHRSREVFRATYYIGTELLYIGSSWSPCVCSSMGRVQQEYITYEFVLTSPAGPRMSGLFNFYSFCDGWPNSYSFEGCYLEDLSNTAQAFLCNCLKLFFRKFSWRPCSASI